MLHSYTRWCDPSRRFHSYLFFLAIVLLFFALVADQVQLWDELCEVEAALLWWQVHLGHVQTGQVGALGHLWLQRWHLREEEQDEAVNTCIQKKSNSFFGCM